MHTLSVLLFYHFSREFFPINYATISISLRHLLYATTHGTKFPKSMLQKIYFSKRMTALQTSSVANINAKYIQLRPRALSLSFKVGKRYKICFLWEIFIFFEENLFFSWYLYVCRLTWLLCKKIILLSFAILLLNPIILNIRVSSISFWLDFSSILLHFYWLIII